MTNPLHDTLFAPQEGREEAFLHLPGGDVMTHAAFAARAAKMAGALVGAGLKPGERLACQIAKSADALALYAACARVGVVLLPLNTAYTAPEIAYFVQDAEAALLVCGPGDADVLGPVADSAGARLMTLGPDGDGTLAQATDAASPASPVARDGSDLAAFLYTSGTTGRSKGAMLSQDNLLSNAHTLADAWRFTRDDTLIHALPIFHTHGLFVAVNVTLTAGGSTIWLPKFDAAAVMAAMSKATAMMGVPTFYTRLLAEDGLTRDATRHMRLFVSGSAPMLPETHRQWTDRTGHRILERYGMTETNMNTSNPHDGDRRPGTVGLPLPGVELRICTPGTADPVPLGETGMIEVRGPNVFRGYWRMPEKTAAELRPNGWFITGDLGRQDADGYVTIVGRDKDLVISGGFNIYPREVEEVLDGLPGVLESAVIGVPHPDMGEGIVAVIVPDGTPPDEDTLREAVAGRLARFKQPRVYVVVSELPRNTMGKVQKAELRKVHAGAFAS
ncbi:malonate--CoA ligase [Jannaschia pohangensis]|uniref:Malonyl-CoA/methylmalonyl-CoA synthetase n=1 Tax=Jannaschia pohangensis TaxID=390807 RepID=A0A1I3IKD9_9RHOB|nr:malonyl-CoA synthase [Jannaschia pohangensis]SFI48444.1 malonyl-CoA/methylmalonyl-CoA synthetase [Jannaschia pohangensis]